MFFYDQQMLICRELDFHRGKYHRESARFQQERQHWEFTTSESYERLLESQHQLERQLRNVKEELGKEKQKSTHYYNDMEHWKQQCTHLESRIQQIRDSAENLSVKQKDTFQREYNLQQQVSHFKDRLQKERKDHETTTAKFEEALATAEELEHRLRSSENKEGRLQEVNNECSKLREELTWTQKQLEER